MKKKLLLSMAAAMALSSSLTVCAAPQYMADGAVFDPEWYLEQNADVASGWSLGTSADAIYQHYTMHGASEGRKPFNEATLDMAGILPYQGTNTSYTTDKTTSTLEQENEISPQQGHRPDADVDLRYMCSILLHASTQGLKSSSSTKDGPKRSS